MAEKYKLIRDESLRELMIAHYRQGYAIQLLSYICYKHNLDTALSLSLIHIFAKGMCRE